MFNILNKKILLILAPIVVFSFFAVNDVLAYSAGDVQKVPDGYGLTAIGFGSDDTRHNMCIQTAPVNGAGEVDFENIHQNCHATNGNPQMGEKSWLYVKDYNDESVNSKVVAGWSWSADTSGGHGGVSKTPADECYYQEYAPLTNINNRSNYGVDHVDGRTYPGTCKERKYDQESWLQGIVRAPAGEVIIGISKFGLANDADIDSITLQHNTAKIFRPSPVVVKQGYHTFMTGILADEISSPINVNTGEAIPIIASKLVGDLGGKTPYTLSVSDNSAYRERYDGVVIKDDLVSGRQYSTGYFSYLVYDLAAFPILTRSETSYGLRIGFKTPGQKTVTITNKYGKTGTATINVSGVIAPPEVDFCLNIPGTQNSVPSGMTQTSSGNCYSAPTCQITAPAEADRYVNTPIAVKAADGNGTYSWTVSDGNIVSSGADTAAALFNSPGNKTIKVTSAGMEGLCPSVTIKIDVCPNIPGDQPAIPDGMVKDDAGNCVTPAAPIEITKPSCKVVPAPGETNIVKKILAQIGLGKIGEPVYFQGSGGDQASYSWSKFVPDNSFSIDPLVSDSLTTILAQTSGLKMLKVSSGGLSSDMCWAIIQGEPEPAAPTCSFENVPYVDQIPGKLLGVNASGGNGNYAWTAMTPGNVTPTDSDSASAVFNNPGINGVQVASAGKTGTCSILLHKVPEEEIVIEEFPAVSCSPSSQSAKIGDTVSFSAGGGDGNYSWSMPAVERLPDNTATAKFDSAGEKNIIVSSGGNSAVCRVNVSEPARPAPTVNIWTDPAGSINLPADTYTLQWNSENANSCSVSGAWSGSGTSGYQTFTNPRGTYNYSVTCQNESGSASDSVSVSIREIPSCSFTANPTNIVPPQKSVLSWSCERVSGGCNLDGSSVGASGNKDVDPQKTTTYALNCFGADGNSRNEATVTIDFIPWLKEIIPIWN